VHDCFTVEPILKTTRQFPHQVLRYVPNARERRYQDHAPRLAIGCNVHCDAGANGAAEQNDVAFLNTKLVFDPVVCSQPVRL